MNKLIAYAAVVCVSTMVVGYFTSGRVSANVEQYNQRLSALPPAVPGWEMNSSEPLDPAQSGQLQCFGSLVRNYVSPKTGDRIVAAMLLGPHGPMSLHDPNVCYPTAGFKVVNEKRRETFKVNGKDVELWVIDMQKGEVGGGWIRVAWGWNDGSGWASPDNPRIKYAGKPFLFKLQVVQELKGNPNDDDKGLSQFMTSFLPLLDKQLNLAESTAVASN